MMSPHEISRDLNNALLIMIFQKENCPLLFAIILPLVAAQAVRWSGIPKVARSLLSQCSKSCGLQPIPHCSVQHVER